MRQHPGDNEYVFSNENAEIRARPPIEESVFLTRGKMPVVTNRASVSAALPLHTGQHRCIQCIALGSIAAFTRALAFSLFFVRFFHELCVGPVRFAST
jgi:hypothetical protein